MILKTAVSTGATILLATDFSKPARQAFTYALKLAAVLKSRLIFLHVIKAPPGFESWSPGARRSLEPLKTKALLALGRVARLAHENGVTAEHRLLVGIPVDSILKVAEGTRTDLIINGDPWQDRLGSTPVRQYRGGGLAESSLPLPDGSCLCRCRFAGEPSSGQIEPHPGGNGFLSFLRSRFAMWGHACGVA
jgi:nucleotide-binding universal stress UspA family protein